MNVVEVMIAEYLHFDVLGLLDVLLYQNAVVFEGFQGFSLGGLQHFLKLLLFVNNSHAFASSPHNSLY